VTPAATREDVRGSLRERAARGKAARAQAPRSAHAAWEPPADRPDPVAVLRQDEEMRVAELLPIRYGRMLASPFAFFRGSAAVMASDLAPTPTSGLPAQLCGDAHLANFGGFAAPDRELVFDVNDFDETLPGPWEWDLKRLAASVALAGRERGFDERERHAAVQATVRAYRGAIRQFAQMRYLDVWYARLDVAGIFERWADEVTGRVTKRFERTLAKARRKDSLRALSRLTERVGDQLRIVSDPPLIVPIEEELAPGEGVSLEDEVRALLGAYRQSLAGGARHLIERYRYAHAARKVVGVGSVGTRAWIVLLLGDDDRDPLFLQLKEAGASVLEPFVGASAFVHHGRRVVEGQWLMQAAGDSFLGWITTTGLDGRRRDFYVRQLWDAKLSVQLERMTPNVMSVYGEMCAWTLARAHARSGDPVAIGGYLGSGERFDVALAAFAETYASQAERDHAALAAAVAAGDVAVTMGM
jgi:uncharacterized protein (DUF2252 family)